jgi:hypothetical protein
MSYRFFLEQRINIKFFVKFGKDASDTCAMLSEASKGKNYEKVEVFLSGINYSKRVARTWMMMKEVVVQDDRTDARLHGLQLKQSNQLHLSNFSVSLRQRQRKHPSVYLCE